MEMLSGLFFIAIIFAAVGYVLVSWAWYKIAKKMYAGSPWFAFFPVLDVFLMIQLSGLPWWLIILIFIPYVNGIFFIVLFVLMLKRLGQNPLMVLLFLLPLVNIIYLYYLAYSSNVVCDDDLVKMANDINSSETKPVKDNNYLINNINDKNNKQQESDRLKEVKDYIKANKSSGIGELNIKDSLLKVGWSESDIDLAFNELKK